MRLHFHPLSGCSRRVLAFLYVHDIPFEPVLVALEKGEHLREPFLALNPAGRVPVLEAPDVGVLSESVAILRYLASRFAPATLGENEAERARVDQWTSWSLAHASAAGSRLNAETGLKRMRGQEPEPSAVRAATDALDTELRLAARTLATRPFLASDRPTIADFVLAPNLESTQALAGYSSEEPAVRAWMDRMQQQPRWPDMRPHG